jgi:membrane protein
MASGNSDVAHPRGSPWRVAWSGRKEVFGRVKHEIKHDRISLIAAGAAFFAFLSIFPAMVAVISAYGLVTDPWQVEAQLAAYMDAVPAPAAELLSQQMRRIAESAPDTLGWSAVVGVVVALWSANKGMKAMVSALGIAYGQREQRGFLRLNALSLALTAGALLFLIVSLALSAAIPIALGIIGLYGAAATIIAVLRWPLLALFVIIAVSSLYRWAPRRPSPNWRWLTPGAVAAALMFLLVSAGMSFYVSRFGAQGEVYGSVAAVAVLMLWLFLIAFAVLFGAELNAAIERRELDRRSPSASS